MQLPEPNPWLRGDPCACFRMLLSSFWFVLVFCQLPLRFVLYRRETWCACSFHVGASERVQIGFGFAPRLHSIEVSWRCPVASSAVPSVGSALSPSYMLAIDLATTGLKSRNLIAGETLHLAEDVRVALDYLGALDDGRYRCVVMPVRMDLIGLLGQMYHHAVWLSDLLSAKAGKS